MIKSSDNSEHYNWDNKCDGWHLPKSPTLSIIQERVPSGCSEVRHFHCKAEQFFFVLSGVATLEVDGIEYEIHERQGVHVPAGVSHQLKNEHGTDVIFTVTSTPPSHGDRIEA